MSFLKSDKVVVNMIKCTLLCTCICTLFLVCNVFRFKALLPDFLGLKTNCKPTRIRRFNGGTNKGLRLNDGLNGIFFAFSKPLR